MNDGRMRVMGMLGGAALLGASLVALPAAAGAGGWTGGSGGWPGGGSAPTLYVSNAAAPAHSSGSTWSHGQEGDGHGGCASAAYTTIGAAVAAAPSGATIVVCPGTYTEDVTLNATVHLIGQGATIDASGLDNGVLVHASGSSVSGFTVTNAIGEGILVQGTPGTPVTHVTVSNNRVTANDQGALSLAGSGFGGYAECVPAGGIPGDCGEGIHLMVAADSVVSGNEVWANTGGILLTDEFGPTHGNLVVGNNVHDNAYDCGITVVGHNFGAFANGAPQPAVGGVYDNTIQGNRSVDNGVLGQGAGVVIATPAPGGAVYDNHVIGNFLSGNGLAGVTVHSHAPGQDVNGNVVAWNLIGTNNLDGDPDFYPAVDGATTGVVVASVAPLSITVSHNLIAKNTYGIWTTSPVTLVGGASSDAFVQVTTPLFVAP